MRAGSLDLSPAGATLGFGDLLLDALLKRDPVKDLRESLQGWLAGDKTFALDTEDEVFLGLDERVGPSIDFVVAGHTHLARAIRRKRGRGCYFNSGTWVRLIRLSEAMLADDHAFAPVYQAFRGQTLEALDGVKDLVFRNPTVVSIEVEGDAVVGVLRRAVEAGSGVDLVADPASRLALSRGSDEPAHHHAGAAAPRVGSQPAPLAADAVPCALGQPRRRDGARRARAHGAPAAALGSALPGRAGRERREPARGQRRGEPAPGIDPLAARRGSTRSGAAAGSCISASSSRRRSSRCSRSSS